MMEWNIWFDISLFVSCKMKLCWNNKPIILHIYVGDIIRCVILQPQAAAESENLKNWLCNCRKDVCGQEACLCLCPCLCLCLHISWPGQNGGRHTLGLILQPSHTSSPLCLMSLSPSLSAPLFYYCNFEACH